MNTNLKFGAAVATSLVIGFLVGREKQAASNQEPARPSVQSSNFENEALGFLNWFRLSGRDEIPKSDLLRNLHLLESKAIASGKLIAFRGSPSGGKATGKPNGEVSTD